jgi:hypothetical protein
LLSDPFVVQPNKSSSKSVEAPLLQDLNPKSGTPFGEVEVWIKGKHFAAKGKRISNSFSNSLHTGITVKFGNQTARIKTIAPNLITVIVPTRMELKESLLVSVEVSCVVGKDTRIASPVMLGYQYVV